MNSKKDERAALSKAQMIEWQVCEDERDWQMEQTQRDESPKVEAQRQQWWQSRLLRWGAPSLLVVLVLALAGGWWLWGRAQRGLDEIKTELEAVVITDLLSTTPTRTPTKAALQEPSVLNGVILQRDVGEMIKHLEILDLGKDWAVIEVLMQPTVAGPTYRQTRVYRYGERGWIREETTAQYWGVARRLESNYFVFHYYALDEKAVAQAAARLDAIYVTLNASFFGQAPAAEKLTISVDPQGIFQPSGDQQAGASTMVVVSPAAMLAPAELDPSDVLLQSLVLSLFNHFTTEAAARYTWSSRWHDMYNGLRLWLIWDQKLPLAIWRKPLVKWIFSDSQSAAEQESFIVPEFAHDLCQDHKLWMRSPLDIELPIRCWSQDGGEEKIVPWRFYQPPLEIPLASLIYKPAQVDNLSMLTHVPQPEAADATVELATMLEYVASTYGAERVQVMLAAVPEHEQAETLIPAVLGLSLQEFESGWREFLQEQYEIKP